MSTQTEKDQELIKNSRRSKKRKAGDGSIQRRLIFLAITTFYTFLTWFWINNYKTDLPKYQANTLVIFYAFYIIRTTIGNFYLRFDNYFGWAPVIILGLIIFPLLTLPPGLFPRPMPSKAGIKYMMSVFLYMVGSIMHSSYEFTRFFFKQNVNKGKLYKSGLSSLVRHPNFCGDLILYIGWMLLSNNIWTLLIPCYQFYYFYKQLIPELESYLRAKYGHKQFDDYAKDVKALIPFII